MKSLQRNSAKTIIVTTAVIVAAAIFLWTRPSNAQSPTTAEADYKPMPGPMAVKTITFDWKDAKRDRTVPVRIYFPETLQGKYPVILFSHGLGGSRDGYSYLGKTWASFGYICVHLQHIGSDDSVWQDVPLREVMSALRKAAANPENVINRAMDVKFAIDQLEKLNKDDEQFKGHLDLDRIGIAGHSFGALTALTAAGEVFVTPLGKLSWREPRIKAAIAMSEPVPHEQENWPKAFAKITIPMMHMTGTLDDSPVGDTKAAERRVPFDRIPAAADQYLVIFDGADHLVFSGRGRAALVMGGHGSAQKDKMFHALILQATTAFWDSYLKDDASARTWLSGGPCKQMLGDDATLEIKAASK